MHVAAANHVIKTKVSAAEAVMAIVWGPDSFVALKFEPFAFVHSCGLRLWKGGLLQVESGLRNHSVLALYAECKKVSGADLFQG